MLSTRRAAGRRRRRSFARPSSSRAIASPNACCPSRCEASGIAICSSPPPGASSGKPPVAAVCDRRKSASLIERRYSPSPSAPRRRSNGSRRRIGFSTSPSTTSRWAAPRSTPRFCKVGQTVPCPPPGAPRPPNGAQRTARPTSPPPAASLDAAVDGLRRAEELADAKRAILGPQR